MLAAVLVAAGPRRRGRCPGADGIGDAYFPLDGNGGIDVLRYRIQDRYRFPTRRLSGRTVLTVEATQDLSSFNLDFLLPVRGVTVDGVRAGHDKPHRHEVVITPKTPIANGDTFTVSVSYAGRPGRDRLPRGEELARQPPRGRGDEPAPHGDVVVPRPTTTPATRR